MRSPETLKLNLFRQGFTDNDLKMPADLTVAQFNAAPSDLQDLWIISDSNAVDAIFAREANRAQNLATAREWQIEALWRGDMSEEDKKAGYAAGDSFAKKYPQFVRSIQNAESVCQWMAAQNLDGRNIESYVAAFEALASAGRIELSPAAIGAGPERSVTGYALKTHANLDRLLMPASAVAARNLETEMSASEYRAAHPELEEKGRSPFETRAVEQAVATFLQVQPRYSGSETNRKKMREYILKTKLPRNAVQSYEEAFQHLVSTGELVPDASAVVEGSTVRLTQYEPRAGGYPQTAKIEKTSFRNLVESMSAAELAERCRIDSKFKEALDNL